MWYTDGLCSVHPSDYSRYTAADYRRSTDGPPARVAGDERHKGRFPQQRRGFCSPGNGCGKLCSAPTFPGNSRFRYTHGPLSESGPRLIGPLHSLRREPSGVRERILARVTRGDRSGISSPFWDRAAVATEPEILSPWPGHPGKGARMPQKRRTVPALPDHLGGHGVRILRDPST